MKLRTPLLALVLAAAAGCEPEDRAAWPAAVDTQVLPAKGYVTVRRFVDHAGTVPGTITERVVRAPDGRVKIAPTAWNDVAIERLPPGPRAYAEDLRERYEGGAGRFAIFGRDPGIRDAKLFAANYNWRVLDERTEVAGRPAFVIEARPRVPDRPWAVLWIDRENLMLLKGLEYAPSGALAAELETLSIDLAPDLSGESFPVEVASDVIELSEAQVDSFADWTLYEPTYLPHGFVLTRIRAATIGGQRVLAWSFEDGFQEMLFVQYPELEGEDAAAEGAPAGGPLEVRISMTGTSLHAHCVIGGTQIHWIAKLHSEELSTILEGLVERGSSAAR